MKKIPVAVLALALAVVAGCSSRSAEKAVERTKEPQVYGEFKTQIIRINEHEHITLYDMPNYTTPLRCWVWVDDVTRTSHMRCDSDMPEMPDTTN